MNQEIYRDTAILLLFAVIGLYIPLAIVWRLYV